MGVIKFFFKKYAAIIIGLLGFSFGIGVMCVTLPARNENSLGIMMTLLSVIITLGVAYSFFSVFKADSEIKDVKDHTKYIDTQRLKDLELIQKQVDDLRKELTSSIIKFTDLNNTNRIQYEFQKINMEASGQYQDRKYLLAIKDELESIYYLLNNRVYLDYEFAQSIGRKRANISNDILQLVNQMTKDKFIKIGRIEFSNSHDTIIRLKESIVYHKDWDIIPIFEKQRYDFLFKVISLVLKELQCDEFPLLSSSKKILSMSESDVKARLTFYHKKFIIGDKSDKDNDWSAWYKEYNQNL